MHPHSWLGRIPSYCNKRQSGREYISSGIYSFPEYICAKYKHSKIYLKMLFCKKNENPLALERNWIIVGGLFSLMHLPSLCDVCWARSRFFDRWSRIERSPTRFFRWDTLLKQSEEHRAEEKKKTQTSSMNLLKSIVTHCEGRAWDNTIILFCILIKKRSKRAYCNGNCCLAILWQISVNYFCIFC